MTTPDTPTDPGTPATPRKRSPVRYALALLLSVILPAAVIYGGWRVATELLATPPKAERRHPTRLARLVEVQPVEFTAHAVTVPAMGTVGSAREVEIRPRVSGEVVEVGERLVLGAQPRKGDLLFRVDPADFELVIAQREAELALAQSSLEIEEGQQAVARRELELLGEIDDLSRRDRELLLRGPQLRAARAEVERAELTVARARLDLARCRITAPFDALVRSESVDLGTQVSPGASVARLVGTAVAWIEATVPVDRLAWIRFPGPDGTGGSSVVVRDEAAWPAGMTRRGRVLRLVGDLELAGRMARVLIEVDDPFALGEGAGPALLLDSYVRVAIEGRSIERAARIDRSLLRDGDRVWLLDADDRLVIRDVTITWRDRGHVLVTGGLEPGDRLVVSDLPAAVEGMALRTAEPDASPADSGGASDRGTDREQ